MRVDLEPFGDGHELAGIADRADNLRPAFEEIADAYRARFGFVFASNGRESGNTWAVLRPGYAQRKAKIRPGARRGVFTGVLRDSLTRQHARHAVERITADSVTVATSAPHAHLFERGRGGQKARHLTPTRRRLETTARDIVTLHLSSERFTGVL